MDIFETILAALGVVTAFGAAITYFIKLYKWYKAPNEEQDKRLGQLEKKVERHDELLANDKTRLDRMEKSNAVEMRALLAMVNHMIDNNHTDTLLQVRKELSDYLTERP